MLKMERKNGMTELVFVLTHPAVDIVDRGEGNFW
jgi:hypothetical protein